MTFPDRIYQLRNPVQEYPWGSRVAIPRLLGTAVPAPRPQAELWMGDHPRGMSEIRTDQGWMPIGEAIRRHADAILGPRVAQTYGGRLPFLFKVLAAEQPLSVQAHPDREQARQGFAREEAAGVPRDAYSRNYRDQNHKPEIVYSLTRFTLLRGFRRAMEIDALVARVGLADLLPSATSPGGLRRLLAAVLYLDAGALADTLQALDRGLENLPELERTWIRRLRETFPGDRGLLAPLFLEVLELDAGQAVYTGPGILHAYLDGVGMELMASSDNVLRGGCTNKHVDPDELLRIVRFPDFIPGAGVEAIGETGALVAAREVDVPGQAPEACFETPAEDFLLSRICPTVGRPANFGDFRPTSGRGSTSSGYRGPEIFFCTSGSGVALGADGSRLPFEQGSSMLVPACLPGFRLEGEATLFRASQGRFPAAAE